MGGSAAVITLDYNISADSVTLICPLTSALALILNIEIFKGWKLFRGDLFPHGT